MKKVLIFEPSQVAVTGLRATGTPVIDCVRPAWGGVWQYFFYLGA